MHYSIMINVCIVVNDVCNEKCDFSSGTLARLLLSLNRASLLVADDSIQAMYLHFEEPDNCGDGELHLMYYYSFTLSH